MAAPIIIAATKGDLATVQQLIASGTDVNITMADGLTPLYISAQNGHKEIVNALIAAGANIDLANTNGTTPLFISAQQGHIDTVNALIVAGANINLANTNGATPLYIAAQNGRTEIVNALIAAGANIDMANKNGLTPLYISAQQGHIDTVNALIAAGANMDMAKTNGATPLFISAEIGHKEIVNALIAAGANMDMAKTNGVTPLYISAQNGHTEIVNALIAAGANVNLAKPNSVTPLYISAQQGHKEIVNALIAAGANVNTLSTEGVTPLYISAQNGYIDIVNALIAAGADLTMPIFQSKSMIQHAKESRFESIINEAILAAAPKWQPATQSSVSLFDAIFDTDAPTNPATGLPTGVKSVAINTSTCPVCFTYTIRSEACNYMKHNCLTHGNYYHVNLYNKFKSPEGNITWCTICGRICSGHRHYELSDPDDKKKPDLVSHTAGANIFADDCTIGGGGGLDEKFKRFRRAREVMKELDASLRFDEAMDGLIEEMWRAPRVRFPAKAKLNAMRAAKKFTNYPTENFPPNVRHAVVAEPVVEKVIASLPTSRLPDVVELDTEVMNAATLDMIEEIVQLKHESGAHVDEGDVTKDVDRIGIASFFDVLEVNLPKGVVGPCWKSECPTQLHPDEVDEVLRLATLNAQATEKYRSLAKRYREVFTMKYGTPVGTARGGATGGGQAAPAGGAGLGRRGRRTRKGHSNRKSRQSRKYS